MNGTVRSTNVAHSSLYRGRRIVIRPSGVPDYAWCAFVDGWPVSNRRRGHPGGFNAIDQAIGRCKVVIDAEAPARRWRSVQRGLRQLRTALTKLLTGDRRSTRPMSEVALSGSEAASAPARRPIGPGRQPARPLA